jgi:calcium binding protein
MVRYAPAVDTMSRAPLDALVEEATVDRYGEDEQAMALYTSITDNLALPFQTTVLTSRRNTRPLPRRSTVEDSGE